MHSSIGRNSMEIYSLRFVHLTLRICLGPQCAKWYKCPCLECLMHYTMTLVCSDPVRRCVPASGRSPACASAGASRPPGRRAPARSGSGTSTSSLGGGWLGLVALHITGARGYSMSWVSPKEVSTKRQITTF